MAKDGDVLLKALEAIMVVVDTYKTNLRESDRDRVTNLMTNIQIVGEQMNNSNETNINNSTVIAGNASVGGDINTVIAEKIEHSFNKASRSEDVSQELVNLLKELASHITTITHDLPVEVAEDIADDFESLSKEVTKKKPRQKQYQVSAEGLIDAAKTVGKIAEPIISTTNTILEFLAKSGIAI